MKFTDFLNKLNIFLARTNMSQSELSRISGVSQAQISDWIRHGRGVRVSENVKLVLTVIENEYKADKIPIPVDIENAIRRVWNGDPSREAIIVNLIDSIGPAFD